MFPDVLTADAVAPTQTDAAARIKRISQRPLFLKMLVHGEPGAGKTYLACTAPKPIVLLTEASVADATMYAILRERGVDVPVWEITTLEDLRDAYEYLRAGNHEFETAVVDSLTDLNRRVISTVLDDAVVGAKGRYHDPDVLEQRDWGRVRKKMLDIILAFRNLPMHVVMTALTLDVREEKRRVPFVQPRGLAAELPGFFNCVGYLSAIEIDGLVVRRLVLQETERYAAKNPGNMLPTVIENPDLSELIPKVVGSKTDDDAERRVN